MILILLTIYSYCLIDLNLTLINTPAWNTFRESVIQIGYFKRDISWLIYLILVSLLFLFHIVITKNYKKYNPITISLTIGLVLLFSYPFLSHDFFNYMFDAKILTFYHQNPYLFRALDFPTDPWLRFMHWTHRTYPYGPTFLLISLIPSFFSAGKLFFSYFLFKFLFVFFYVLSVFYLRKIDKKSALFFATNPLIIIEGLASSHNDLVAVGISLAGIYLLSQKKVVSRILLILSAGIKYITIPVIFIRKDTSKAILMVTLMLILYICFTGEIQPWYFLNLFIFLPYFPNLLSKFNIFILGLLLSYYPYIRLGGWDSSEKVTLKHTIIAVFFVLNILYLLKSPILALFRSQSKNTN